MKSDESAPWHHSHMMFQSLRDMATGLRSVLADLEPERLSGPDAARLLEVFSEIEKLAAGGRLLAARRVESSNVWRRQGHRSAAAHVAEATGTGMGPAITALEAARQLDSLPATAIMRRTPGEQKTPSTSSPRSRGLWPLRQCWQT